MGLGSDIILKKIDNNPIVSCPFLTALCLAIKLVIMIQYRQPDEDLKFTLRSTIPQTD
jgi:hypothetical protein